MWSLLATIRRYLFRYRWGLAAGAFCLIVKDVAQAVQPLMIRGAVDSLTAIVRGGPGSHTFVRFALFLVALAALKGVFQYWMRVVIIGISRNV